MIVRQHDGWTLWNPGAHPAHCTCADDHSFFHICGKECSNKKDLKEAMKEFEEKSFAPSFIFGKSKWL